MKTLSYFSLILLFIGTVFAKPGANAVRLKPGDQLEIEIYQQDDMTAAVPVEATGEASFPLLEPIVVAGMTLKEARAVITDAYKPDFFVNPVVTLRIAGLAKGKVSIIGAVNVQKDLIIERGEKVSLTQAIAAAGGIAANADPSNVILRPKDGGKPTRYNYAKLSRPGANPVFLSDGDSVDVGIDPMAGKTISILGEVIQPGNKDYNKAGMTVKMLIGTAGGLKRTADAKRIRITRNGKVGGLNNGLKTRLFPNDVVEVPQNIFVGKFVTMAGFIENQGALAFPLNGKLTVSQAIANAGGPQNLGDLRKVTITRNGRAFRHNVRDARKGKVKPFALQPGDEVTIGQRTI